VSCRNVISVGNGRVCGCNFFEYFLFWDIWLHFYCWNILFGLVLCFLFVAVFPLFLMVSCAGYSIFMCLSIGDLFLDCS